MAFHFDPRGDLPPPMILPTSYMPRHAEISREHKRCSMNVNASPRQKLRPKCYDWIFSSASNMHVSTDRSSFKNYVPFKSYVLTIADRRQIFVHGIGTVDLRIKCQPGNKESHMITLENVLHVPGWMCNIFSDIYFSTMSDFEHTWTDYGVSFFQKEDGKLKYWGFTEEFCGLDKLVLARDIRGRSPMLEDKDREVFSINLTWPQSQRERWNSIAALEKPQEEEQESLRTSTSDFSPPKINPRASSLELTREQMSGLTLLRSKQRAGSLEMKSKRRSGLTEISGNIVRRGPSTRTSSLKATTLSNGSLIESSM